MNHACSMDVRRSMQAGRRSAQGAGMVERLALESTRLRLRNWHDEDLDPLVRLCADPEVMRYNPARWSRDDCAPLMVRSRLHLPRNGFGLRSGERRVGKECVSLC